MESISDIIKQILYLTLESCLSVKMMECIFYESKRKKRCSEAALLQEEPCCPSDDIMYKVTDILLIKIKEGPVAGSSKHQYQASV